jgi:hypothetical protein
MTVRGGGIPTCPLATARQLPDQSTTVWMESSSIGDTRLRGDSCPRRSPKDQAKTPFLSALRGLRVDDRHRRACFTSLLLSHRHVQRVMDALQGAVPVPELEIVVHRALRRQILGQRLPLAAGPQHVEDPVEHLAHVHRPSAPAVPAWRDHGAQRCPIRHQLDRSGNEGHGGPPQDGVQASTSGALQRIKRQTRNHI